jgi:hypothetical protein
MAVVTSHSEGLLLTRGERLNDPAIAGISKKGNLVCALTATKPDIKGLNGWSHMDRIALRSGRGKLQMFLQIRQAGARTGDPGCRSRPCQYRRC